MAGGACIERKGRRQRVGRGRCADRAGGGRRATQIAADLAAQDATLAELRIDRAFLASVLVRDRPGELAVFCKAWRVRNGPRFAKTDFTLDFDHGQLVCPAGQMMAFTPGGNVQFPAAVCQACPLRPQCTTSARGRSVQVHPTSGCWPSSANASSLLTGGPGCASASWSSTTWPRSATGRAAAPATRPAQEPVRPAPGRGGPQLHVTARQPQPAQQAA